MSTSEFLSEARKRLDELSRKIGHAARELRTAADEMESGESWPAESLHQFAVDAKRDFETLWKEAIAFAESRGVLRETHGDERPDMDSLTTLYNRIEEKSKLQDKLVAALDRLRSVYKFSHVSKAEFKPLDDLKRKIKTLEDRIEAHTDGDEAVLSNEEITEFEALYHPAFWFIDLVQRRSDNSASMASDQMEATIDFVGSACFSAAFGAQIIEQEVETDGGEIDDDIPFDDADVDRSQTSSDVVLDQDLESDPVKREKSPSTDPLRAISHYPRDGRKSKNDDEPIFDGQLTKDFFDLLPSTRPGAKLEEILKDLEAAGDALPPELSAYLKEAREKATRQHELTRFIITDDRAPYRVQRKPASTGETTPSVEVMSTPNDADVGNDDTQETGAGEDGYIEASPAWEEDVESEAEYQDSSLEALTASTNEAAPTAQANSAEALATQILESPSDNAGSHSADLLWLLIEDGDFALAYQLSKTCSKESDGMPPPELCELLLAAEKIQASHGHLADRYQELLINVLYGDGGVDRLSENARDLFTMACTLRPSLIGPVGSGASAVLRDIDVPHEYSGLRAYVESIIEYRNTVQEPLDVGRLLRAESWSGDLNELEEEIRDWVHRAPKLVNVGSDASRIWTEFFDRDLWPLFNAILTSDADRSRTRKAVGRTLAELGSSGGLRDRIRELTKDHSKSHRKGGLRGHSARDAILRQAEDGLNFLRRWYQFVERDPTTSDDYITDRARELRDKLRELHADAIAGCGVDILGSGPERASLACVIRTLLDIAELLDDSISIAVKEPDWLELLFRPLLKTPLPLCEISIESAKGENRLGHLEIIDLLPSILNRSTDWNTALDNHLLAGDIWAARQVLEQITNDLGRPQFEKRVATSFAQNKALLTERLEEARLRIEHSVARGEIPDTDREPLRGSVDALGNALEQNLVVRFAVGHRILDSVVQRLEDEGEKARVRVGRRLQRLTQGSVTDQSRIQSLIDDGDVATAEDFIALLQDGQHLPQSLSRDDPFATFFPEKATELSQAELNLNSLRESIDARNAIAGIALDSFSDDEIRRSQEILDQWFMLLRSASQATPESLSVFMEALGFANVSVETNESRSQTASAEMRRHRWYWFNCAPIQDRSICPVPSFGSEAHGHYRLFIDWSRSPVQEMFGTIGKTVGEAPLLVIYFGSLSTEDRRKIADFSRDRGRRFLVLDTVLLTYLALRQNGRLPTFFRCALPLTSDQPYVTTASLVPPEMFFGRHQERASIIDPHGSCFVYGGRQLGKTSLLRDIVRTNDRPHDNFYTIFLDLESEGLGSVRDKQDLWQLLVKAFKDEGIFPSQVRRNLGAEGVVDRIVEWLDENPRRRILLLLDEADDFLKYDADDEFAHSKRLRGLMNSTNRRFKVVFSGLHNVQRSTRVHNHPLAHFGQPICIGPLLQNREYRDASDLIRVPFESLGYKFESDDLIATILAQTNYYPSLIQLYCKELLHHVTSRGAHWFDLHESPPYVITRVQLSEAYRSTSLHNAIKDRFRWTIELDERYQVIAYELGLEALDDEDVLAFGVSARKLRDRLIEIWPEGFENEGLDSFRVLLEEMVGLGVLREAEGSKFTLRSANLIQLMGTRDEIIGVLENEWEVPVQHSARSFRAAWRENDRVYPERRNPLTAEQESMVLRREYGVAIVCGSPASGLDGIEAFLQVAMESDHLVRIPDDAGKIEFEEQLTAIENRPDDKLTAFMVSAGSDWSPDWVAAAFDRISSLTAEHKPVRIIFSADPAKAYAIRRDVLNWESQSNFTLVSLRPWQDAAIRQWLEGCTFSSNSNQRQRVRDITGGWPVILDMLYERTKGNPIDWDSHLDDFEQQLSAPSLSEEIITKMGLRAASSDSVFDVMLKWGEAIDQDDIVELLPAISEMRGDAAVHDLLTWAERLHLVQSKGEGRWSLDPFVQRRLRVLAP